MIAYLQLGAGHTTWMRRKEDINHNEDMHALSIDLIVCWFCAMVMASELGKSCFDGLLVIRLGKIDACFITKLISCFIL